MPGMFSFLYSTNQMSDFTDTDVYPAFCTETGAENKCHNSWRGEKKKSFSV